MPMSIERERLTAEGADWKRWGPYLSERAWGTVREDYSANGAAWDYFTHDMARSRAYRWSEDGLAGICDDDQRLCFALALWNGRDPILKERLFGLTGSEGNHGEDVKEAYFYLDSTPTHSYMRMLYKYPQAAFPYSQLVAENRRRGKEDFEYELLDTGVFAENRYFDVFIEYAKSSPDDILIRIEAINRGPEAATLHLLPTLWFRNTWAWGRESYRPELCEAPIKGNAGLRVIRARHEVLGDYALFCEGAPAAGGAPTLLFTENETNLQRLYGVPNPTPYVKDAFHEYIVAGRSEAVNPAQRGTKAAALYIRQIKPGASAVIRLRLSRVMEETGEIDPKQAGFKASPTSFDSIFARRRQQADEFYAELQAGFVDAEAPPGAVTTASQNPVREGGLPGPQTPRRGFNRQRLEDMRQVQRQALAGMLWSKQFYHYHLDQWLDGDPGQPPPPPERKRGRNHEWIQLNNREVLSMPDKWEYPWYAAWDLAFHCIPLALVDVDFAKKQLDLMLREWYQHPNGQVPAYEWAFSDVNPPVFAWAAWRLYKMERKQRGQGDKRFLERVFHKLLINFTWWVNRKDAEGNNVFEGGFLGLDNIGVFDRSAPLPTGGFIEQSDGTSWMGMFSLNMMTIALELACSNPVYEDIATKFFEHFLYIAGAMSDIAGEGIDLWDTEDEFFYDVLHLPNGAHVPLRVRSLVGLIPLLAVETIEPELLDKLPGFKERLEWFLTHRQDLASLVSRWHEPGEGERRLMTLVRGHRMKRLLKRMLDPNEFLSPYGVRSLSKYHEDHPYELPIDGHTYIVRYEPAESRSGLFGGNSNWRGPVWFPINYLLIESLQKFHHYYGDDFLVECPTGSGQYLTLDAIADELSHRLINLFLRDERGWRPFNGGNAFLQTDPLWRDHLWFHEYFHGDNGAGLGASHQTGWTGLVAKLIQQQGSKHRHRAMASVAAASRQR
jgi:hypothetical protein